MIFPNPDKIIEKCGGTLASLCLAMHHYTAYGTIPKGTEDWDWEAIVRSDYTAVKAAIVNNILLEHILVCLKNSTIQTPGGEKTDASA